jgi:hypothetical protein
VRETRARAPRARVQRTGGGGPAGHYSARRGGARTAPVTSERRSAQAHANKNIRQRRLAPRGAGRVSRVERALSYASTRAGPGRGPPLRASWTSPVASARGTIVAAGPGLESLRREQGLGPGRAHVCPDTRARANSGGTYCCEI